MSDPVQLNVDDPAIIDKSVINIEDDLLKDDLAPTDKLELVPQTFRGMKQVTEVGSIELVVNPKTV